MYSYHTRPIANIKTLFVNENSIIHFRCQGAGRVGSRANWHCAGKQSDHHINIERKITCLLMAAMARQTIQSECVVEGSYWDSKEGLGGEKLIFHNHSFFLWVRARKWHRGRRKTPKCHTNSHPKNILGQTRLLYSDVADECAVMHFLLAL